jgi:hypothetical protein
MFQYSTQELKEPMAPLMPKEEFIQNMNHLVQHGTRYVNAARLGARNIPFDLRMSTLHQVNQTNLKDIKQRCHLPYIVSPQGSTIPANGAIKISVNENYKSQHYEQSLKIKPLNGLLHDNQIYEGWMPPYNFDKPFIMYTFNSDMLPSFNNGIRGIDPETGSSEEITIKVKDLFEEHKKRSSGASLTQICIKAVVCRMGYRDSLVEYKQYKIGEN